ncbi:MAG: FUSC family protein [Roseibium sp.]|uniref:FUSC family protein n=1 Tax=Roseibium sp. TaxID=1936156 RepID=UPI00261AF15B|nr:FUSC family protein [Roseibium sp.]MCV0424748.1 FUSC family protein [Roseibium sp.]
MTRFIRYDPGALRLVRGAHLMITVVVAGLLAYQFGPFAEGVPGFTLSVLAAAAGAHCLLFTPISTRKQEAGDLFRLGLIMTGLAVLGMVSGLVAGKNTQVVLQAMWIGIIAIGFGIEGFGAFWLRTGRMISIFWLFVIMSNASGSPGVWLPAMTVFGAVLAFLIRIGFWRPSPERTYLRVEKANRQAIADYLKLAANGQLSIERRRRVNVSDIASLRSELELSVDLTEPGAAIQGLSLEAAAMMQLALEVVRDAMAALSLECRAELIKNTAYQDVVGQLQERVVTADTPSGETPFNLAWTELAIDFQKGDKFQLLRIAQAFERIWTLAAGTTQLRADEDTGPEATSGNWWQLITWRLAVQASVAASVGYGIGIYFNLSHAYWVTITVIVVLCGSLGATMKKTLQRSLGTAVGFLFAILLEPILAGYPDIRIALIILLLPPTIVLFERNYGIAAGIISFLVLIGLQTLTGLPAAEFWARLYDTLIGAAVGLTAAWLLFPNRSGDSVERLETSYLNTCAQYLKAGSEQGGADNLNYNQLKATAHKLLATARAYRTERAPWSSFTKSSSKLDTLVILLADYIALYRQARVNVLIDAGKYAIDEPVDTLVAKMDRRIQDEIGAVLDDKGKQTMPGLAEEWKSAMPENAETDNRFMTDWVAMLYYARKVIRCLDGFRRDVA